MDLTLPEDVTDPPLAVRLKDGLVESSGLEWDALILRTEGALDASTLELFAIARIEDPYGLSSENVPLRVGQPVEADIPGRILEGVFVVPREAVSDLSLGSTPTGPSDSRGAWKRWGVRFFWECSWS